MDKVIGISALCLSVLGFLYTLLRDRFGDKQKAMTATVRAEAELMLYPIRQEVRGLSDDIIKIQTQIEIFWSNSGKKAARALHSPGHPEFDRLIEKFERDQLTEDELQEFVSGLRTIENDMGETTGKRHAASVVIESIRHRFGAIIKEADASHAQA